MGEKSSDNQFELISRRHSSLDVFSSPSTAEREKRFSLATTSFDTTDRANPKQHLDDFNEAPIASISGKRSLAESASAPSISTRSRLNRNNLTTSFLRRKRVEYAGMNNSLGRFNYCFILDPPVKPTISICHKSAQWATDVERCEHRKSCECKSFRSYCNCKCDL